MRYIMGGIGDIIISIQHAMNDGVCNLYSHFDGAKEFVESFGVRVNKFVLFRLGEKISIEGERMPINHFPNIQFNSTTKIVTDKQILGIHPFGSKFSEEYSICTSKILKGSFFSEQNIEYIVDSLKDYYHIVCFGTKNELDSIQNISNLNKIHTPISDIINTVNQCNVIIGTDSAIKSIAAAIHIPTYVMMGNYEDNIRDNLFILPYISMGEMKAWKCESYNKEIFNPIIKELLRIQTHV